MALARIFTFEEGLHPCRTKVDTKPRSPDPEPRCRSDPSTVTQPGLCQRQFGREAILYIKPGLTRTCVRRPPPPKHLIGCFGGSACRLEPPKRWQSLARRADLAHANPGLTAEGDRLCETRIDTNSCLLILEPGLLWPGFRKAPAARGSPRRLGSPLSTRRGPCGAPDRRGPAQNWKNMGSCQSWFNGDRRSP